MRDGAKTYDDKLLIEGEDTTTATLQLSVKFRNLDYIKQLNIGIKVLEILIIF